MQGLVFALGQPLALVHVVSDCRGGCRVEEPQNSQIGELRGIEDLAVVAIVPPRRDDNDSFVCVRVVSAPDDAQLAEEKCQALLDREDLPTVLVSHALSKQTDELPESNKGNEARAHVQISTTPDICNINQIATGRWEAAE
jgi:hypothetical protein